MATKFFMPHTGRVEAEASYREIKSTLVSQFRLPITDRRIFNLSYVNSKRKWHAEVGRMEEQEGQYEVLSIYESKQFIIFTRTKRGAAGHIILVDKNEVTTVEDFA